jgi:hypothetical protein
MGIRRENKLAALLGSENEADGDGGVISARFASAFFPELKEVVPLYREIARSAYRELSEFVHGNHQTWELTPKGRTKGRRGRAVR